MKCVNCGANLNAFNTTYPIWDGTEERFCSKCLEKYNKIKTKLVRTQDRDEFTRVNDDLFMSVGMKESGINYIGDYMLFSEERAKEAQKAKEEKEQLDAEIAEEKAKILEDAKANWNRNAADFMATTGYNFEGYKIVKYLGIKSGEVVLGTGFLSEFSAGMSDLFGKTSERMTAKFTDAKETAVARLKENCLSVDANAVIGVDLDVEIMGQNMILACANGTAVRIEKI